MELLVGDMYGNKKSIIIIAPLAYPSLTITVIIIISILGVMDVVNVMSMNAILSEVFT